MSPSTVYVLVACGIIAAWALWLDAKHPAAQTISKDVAVKYSDL